MKHIGVRMIFVFRTFRSSRPPFCRAFPAASRQEDTVSAVFKDIAEILIIVVDFRMNRGSVTVIGIIVPDIRIQFRRISDFLSAAVQIPLMIERQSILLQCIAQSHSFAEKGFQRILVYILGILLSLQQGHIPAVSFLRRITFKCR